MPQPVDAVEQQCVAALFGQLVQSVVQQAQLLAAARSELNLQKAEAERSREAYQAARALKLG